MLLIRPLCQHFSSVIVTKTKQNPLTSLWAPQWSPCQETWRRWLQKSCQRETSWCCHCWFGLETTHMLSIKAKKLKQPLGQCHSPRFLQSWEMLFSQIHFFKTRAAMRQFQLFKPWMFDLKYGVFIRPLKKRVDVHCFPNLEIRCVVTYFLVW